MKLVEADSVAKTLEEANKEESHDPRSVRILAKTIYRELRGSGFNPQDIMALCGELITLVTTDIQAERSPKG